MNRGGTPGQFVLTGSAVPEDDAIRHTGAGRFARLLMHPMSLYESGDSTGAMPLAALLAGEWPTATPTLADCRVYSTPQDAIVYHYRDSDALEVDVIVQVRDGGWGAFEVKLGGERAIEQAAANLRKFADKVDTTKIGDPAVLGIITANGYGYTRADGVVIVPIGALGP